MIVAFKHEDMSSTHLGKFYETLSQFGRDNFDIRISDEGIIEIDDKIASVSYKIGDGIGNSYTKDQAINHYCNSSGFKSFAKSRFWTVYQIKEKII